MDAVAATPAALIVSLSGGNVWNDFPEVRQNAFGRL
jgi:hypothetical protein